MEEDFRRLLSARAETHAATFEELVGPLDVKTFFGKNFGKAPLAVLRDGAPNRYEDLLSCDGLKKSLPLNRYRMDLVKFIGKGGMPLDVSEFAIERHYRNLFDANKVRRFLRDHAGSVLLHKPELYHPAVNRLVNRCREAFLCTVNGNVYYTPRNSRTFDKHWDFTDSFVLQLDGQKDWNVYPPLIRRPHRNRHWHGDFELPDARPLLSVRLRAGDALYLPHGFPHAAITGGSESLHLTLALYAPAWADVLGIYVRKILEDCVDDAEFRVPCAVTAESADGKPLSRSHFRRMMDALSKKMRFEDFLDSVENELVSDGLADLLEGFDVREERKIGPDTALVRPPAIYFLDCGGKKAVLKFHGKIMEFHASTAPLLRRALDGRSFTARTLPGTSLMKSRVAILETLLREGILSFTD